MLYTQEQKGSGIVGNIATSQLKGPGFNPELGLLLNRVSHILTMIVCVGFLPRSKTMTR